MMILRVKGGLGNQLFQYAYGCSLAKKSNQNLILDTSFYYKNNNYRQYKLDQLGIVNSRTTDAPGKYLKSIRKRFLNINFKMLEMGFSPITDIYLDGYYQSEKYFFQDRGYIKKIINFPESSNSLIKKIEETQSIAVHVRRGDYLALPNYQVCDRDYYIRAMRAIKESISDPQYFIFSDDLNWCTELLDEFPNAILINNCVSDIEELHLMTLCKHIVISNSSFSWWGAWIKEYPGKLVMAPSRWVNNPVENKKYMDSEKILPDRWIRI